MKDTSVFANLNFSSIFQYSQKHSNHKIANMELILTMMKNDTLLPNLNFHNENFSLLSFLSNMQSEISNYLYEVGMNAKRNLNEECSEEMDKISKILENMKQFDQQIRDENIGWEGEEKKHAKNGIIFFFTYNQKQKINSLYSNLSPVSSSPSFSTFSFFYVIEKIDNFFYSIRNKKDYTSFQKGWYSCGYSLLYICF